MTDQKDYAMLPEVLKVCGLRLHKYTDPDENYWTDGKWHCRGKRPVLTLSELWEGLKKARQARPDCSDTAVSIREFTDEETHKSEERVVLSGFGGLMWFCTSKYGSLPNAVAAALHWVLQQKGDRNG